MQTNPAAEQSKIIRWSESLWNQSGRKGKVYGGKDLLKSQVLSSEWNTERVREDATGDSEDSEDDELPCVISESAGDCGVTHQYCVWPNPRHDMAHKSSWNECRCYPHRPWRTSRRMLRRQASTRVVSDAKHCFTRSAGLILGVLRDFTVWQRCGLGVQSIGVKCIR